MNLHDVFGQIAREAYESNKIQEENEREEKRKSYLQEYHSIQRTLTEKEKKFNTVRQRFESEQRISGKARRLLKLIEARSYQNHGDTKWADTSIIEETGWSRSTVHRAFVELESHGFSVRLTKRAWNYNKSRPYSDRIIRCFRILLTCGCQVIPKKKMGWKLDHRPPFNFKYIRDPEGNPLSEEWINHRNDDDVFRYIDRIAQAGIDTVDEGFREKLSTLRTFNDKRALNVLGYRRKDDH